MRRFNANLSDIFCDGAKLDFGSHASSASENRDNAIKGPEDHRDDLSYALEGFVAHENTEVIKKVFMVGGWGIGVPNKTVGGRI